jgi:serine/threonine-protein kinase SRPK3
MLSILVKYSLILLIKNAHRDPDIQPNNLLLGIDDETIFSKYEKNELERPVPRKVTEDRILYISQPPPAQAVPPLLCDLGEARRGDEENEDFIMPGVYRAPEVILGMKWSYSVDMWNVAMVVNGSFLIETSYISIPLAYI